MDFNLIILLRGISPLLILKYPLFGVLVASGFDLFDWPAANIQSEAARLSYDRVDKIFDLYYIAVAAFTALWWKDKWARITAVTLFLIRAIGVFLFWRSSESWVLVVFPNLFLNFFVFYWVFLLFSKNSILFNNLKSFFVIMIALLIPKLIEEISIHNSDNKSPTPPLAEITGIDILQGPLQQIVWLIIYLTPPLLALRWRLKQKT